MSSWWTRANDVAVSRLLLKSPRGRSSDIAYRGDLAVHEGWNGPFQVQEMKTENLRLKNTENRANAQKSKNTKRWRHIITKKESILGHAQYTERKRSGGLLRLSSRLSYLCLRKNTNGIHLSSIRPVRPVKRIQGFVLLHIRPSLEKQKQTYRCQKRKHRRHW